VVERWWRGGGEVVWWCGGVVVWWRGGVVVWWCGGVGCISSGTQPDLPWYVGCHSVKPRSDFGGSQKGTYILLVSPRDSTATWTVERSRRSAMRASQQPAARTHLSRIPSIHSTLAASHHQCDVHALLSAAATAGSARWFPRHISTGTVGEQQQTNVVTNKVGAIQLHSLPSGD
jgi:hypothetical protein